MKKKFSLIIGLGQTGLSVARYLKRIKKTFIVFDTRSQPAGLAEFQAEFPEVKIYLEKGDEKNYYKQMNLSLALVFHWKNQLYKKQ